jgi:hypothetical protein
MPARGFLGFDLIFSDHERRAALMYSRDEEEWEMGPGRHRCGVVAHHLIRVAVVSGSHELSGRVIVPIGN